MKFLNIELLDYLLDFDDNFWIVTNLSDKIYGYIVYKVDENGNRYNNITKKMYTKQKCYEIEITKEIKSIFKPRDFYKNNKQNLTGVWKKYVEILNKIGINDIGIFGSYLVGFDIIKDVDFIIYEKENLYKYYDNIELIKNYCNCTDITSEHIEYQYNKFKDQYNNNCDLKEIISRNWSAIQVKEGVLSTPRFIFSERQNIPEKKGVDQIIKVKVIDGLESTCCPRYCKLEYNNEIYDFYSSVWKYQSFAKTNDILEMYANVDIENKIIIIDNPKKYYIKYLN